MAHLTLKAGFPSMPLPAGTKLVLEAINPSADADVAGVTASLWMIYGRDKSATEDLLDEVPMYVAEEAE